MGKDRATTKETAAKLSTGGGIDVCVNAGIAADRRLGDMADEDMDQVVDIKLKHCTLLAHACESAMAGSGRGRVIPASAGIGSAIVPGSDEIPDEFPAVAEPG